ncbi:transcription factor bHLH [Forsythia ovata]|uniref:Transcription factor bHLH n=1 Tax=Forsythia ovata TaxID=205694 RepID=A0ABD1QMN1_9LAMI
MSEGFENEKFLWDDESWEFPILGNSARISQENLDKRMMDIINLDSQGEEVARDVQVPTPMPPPPPPAAGRKRKAAGGADKGKEAKVGGESDHEMHILTERERRKKMRDMFASLHALLPQLPAKADKSTIVDEAVNYIRSLQQTLEKLQKKKLDMIHGMTSTGFGPSIFAPQKLAVESREAFLAEQGSTSTSTAIAIPPVPKFPVSPNFQTYTSPNVVLNTFGEDAHISICAPKKPGLFTAICYVLEKYRLQVVTAQVWSDQYRSMYMIQTHANGPSEHFPGAFPVEEMYKQAAGEIMRWVNA